MLNEIIPLTEQAVGAADRLLDKAKRAVGARVVQAGKVSAAALETHQYAAHGLAWLATYVEALLQLSAYATRQSQAGRFGELEHLLVQAAFGEYLWQIYGGIPMAQGEMVRPQDMGVEADVQHAFMTPAVQTLTQSGNTA